MRPTCLALCLSALAFVTACPPKTVEARGERPRVEVKVDAKADQAPTDMPWGDRMCNVSDPFGHNWAIATHTEDVSPEEMERRMTQG